MALHYLFDLQLFADAGGNGGGAADGGGSGAAGEAAGATGSAYPHNIPERAKRYYDIAAEKKTQNVDTAQKKNRPKANSTEGSSDEARKPTYKEMIESDDYKQEHEKYLQKVIRDRMKKHDAESKEANELLSLIGQKYGLDVKSENFRAELSEAIKDDDSVYERYAEEHDLPLSEAKRLMGLERQLAKAEEEAKAAREKEENDRVINALRAKSEETRKLYPDFDLDTAIRDERFRRLTAAFGGDTTQAYEALNHRTLQRRAVADAEAKAQRTVANSVRANRSRPSEGGLSAASNAAGTVPDFRTMGLDALRAWAAQQRNKTGRW